eukprot:TRINITY_DN15396_c0_g1_i1.p2 TRINITY_DN15396_c0_g1~~TRINITY_DN15396_c0_g1_i1.p2  ORF type:complete len:334 (-),score=104.39 TRINITY_DN15396_c0_g1_i1:317-1318(-)
MSNVKTLRDLEKGPNSQPLPDPWKAHPHVASSYGSAAPAVPSGYGNSSRRYQMGYTGIDGYQGTHTSDQPPGVRDYCLLMCCPCCIGGPCTPQHQLEYRRMCASFSFVVSMIQVIMLIVELSLGGVVSTNENPSIGPGGSTLDYLGAKNAYKMQHDYQIWRFVVPLFLHAGFVHLFFNLYAQIRFGLPQERKWGIVRFIALYFISGIGGVLMSCLLSPGTLSVGSSGAIMGVMGALLIESLMSWHKTDPNQRRVNLFSLVLTIVVIMLLGASRYIDAAGHFGGLLIGAIIGLIYFAKESDKDWVHRIVPISAIATLVVYFVLGFALFYTVVPT